MFGRQSILLLILFSDPFILAYTIGIFATVLFRLLTLKNSNETKPCYVKGYYLPTISLCLIYIFSMVVKINFHSSKIQFPRW